MSQRHQLTSSTGIMSRRIGVKTSVWQKRSAAPSLLMMILADALSAVGLDMRMSPCTT
ncbi:MAG: hypothetical protein AB1586_00370 [Pseudomonadota bacterium]|jgi:hypothetical protein